MLHIRGDSAYGLDMVCLRLEYPSFAARSLSCIAAGVAFTTLVKWRFVLEDGEKELTNAKLTSLPRSFLQQALIRSR